MRENEQSRNIGREALAAVAMAFAPATEIPRERALIRSAIVSLLLNFGDETFDRDKAVDAISGHGALPELRREVAEPLFDKLLSENIVREVGDDKTDVYIFDEEFAKKTYDEQDVIENLIGRVISDLFDTGRLPRVQIPQLRKELLIALARLMKEYGEQYAYQVAGRAEKPITIPHDELVSICRDSMSHEIMEFIDPKDMADAITELFLQSEPHFAKFVFSLTQNYYYLRLVGLAGGLKFLASDRFSGSIFFLDTNMLFPFLLKESRHRRSIMELVEIALQLNISLHETESTLDELGRVIEYYRTKLAKAFDEVPDELVANTQNLLLRAYRARKQQEPTLTVEEYLSQFRDVRETLENDWGVTVFDDPVERELSDKEIRYTKKIINDCSERVRHKKKPDSSVEHDAHIYYVVLAERERAGDKAAYLLTLDMSLAHAARELQGKEELPFCMTLGGFLQIISPYVRADHEQSFAEVFVELVGNNLFPPEEIIDIEDFLMFTDFDLSVRQLPGADVKKVIRGVKEALDGTLPLENERNRVAYEIQKALSDPTLKYRTELEDALKAYKAEIKALKEARDRDSDKHALEVERIESKHRIEFEDLNRKLQAMAAKSEDYELQVKGLLKKHQTAWFLFKAFGSFVVLALLLRGCWWFIGFKSAWFAKPLLCKVLISVTAITTWVGIVSPKAILSTILFIIAVLSLLLSAWAAFVK